MQIVQEPPNQAMIVKRLQVANGEVFLLSGIADVCMPVRASARCLLLGSAILFIVALNLKAQTYKYTWNGIGSPWYGQIYLNFNNGFVQGSGAINHLEAISFTSPYGTLNQADHLNVTSIGATPTNLYNTDISMSFQSGADYLGMDISESQVWVNFINAPSVYDDGSWVGQGIASPTISDQPSTQNSNLGGTANFNVSVSGDPPFVYQWLFNGTNYIESTNSTLTITNIEAKNAGAYQVVVSNVWGAVTSSIAELNVQGVPIIFLSKSGSTVYTNGQFIGLIGSLTGQGQVIVQTSSNMMDWVPIFTNPPTFGTLLFTDTLASNSLSGFYRALTR